MPLLDSTIPLRAQPMGFIDPTQAAASALQVRRLQQDAALQPLRQQQAQAELQSEQQQQELNAARLREVQRAEQERAEDEADQSTIQKVLSQNGDDYFKADKVLAGQIKPRNHAKFQEGLKNYQAALRTKTDQELARNQRISTATVNGIDALTALPDDDLRRGEIFDQVKANIAAEGGDTSKIDQFRNFSNAQLMSLRSGIAGSANTMKLEEDRRKTEAEKAKAQREQREADRVDVAKSFDPAAITNADEWKAFAKSTPESVRSEYMAHVFDPEKTPEFVRRKARTIKEQDDIDTKNKPKADTSLNDDELYRDWAIGQQPGATEDERKRAAIAGTALNRKAQDKAKQSASGNGEKKVTRQQSLAVEVRKQNALKASQKTLQGDIAKAQGDPNLISQAWNDHRERAQAAQDAYEQEIGTLTGQPLEQHFEYPTAEEMQNAGKPKPAPAPSTPTNGVNQTQSAQPEGDEVAVVAPDGREGFVPRAKLDAALKRGFKTK